MGVRSECKGLNGRLFGTGVNDCGDGCFMTMVKGQDLICAAREPLRALRDRYESGGAFQ